MEIKVVESWTLKELEAALAEQLCAALSVQVSHILATFRERRGRYFCAGRLVVI